MMFQLVVLSVVLSVELAFITSFKATNVNVQNNGETSLKMVYSIMLLIDNFIFIILTYNHYNFRMLNYHYYHMIILHLNHILVN
jgi:hypothetical protein